MTSIQHVNRRILAVVHQIQRRIAEDERGALMTEYGLLVILVAIAALGGVALFGEAVLGLFEGAQDQYSDVNARRN